MHLYIPQVDELEALERLSARQLQDSKDRAAKIQQRNDELYTSLNKSQYNVKLLIERCQRHLIAFADLAPALLDGGTDKRMTSPTKATSSSSSSSAGLIQQQSLKEEGEEDERTKAELASLLTTLQAQYEDSLIQLTQYRTSLDESYAEIESMSNAVELSAGQSRQLTNQLSDYHHMYQSTLDENVALKAQVEEVEGNIKFLQQRYSSTHTPTTYYT